MYTPAKSIFPYIKCGFTGYSLQGLINIINIDCSSLHYV